MTLVAVSNTSNGGDHDDDGGRQQLQVEAEMVIYLFVCCLWQQGGLTRTTRRLGPRVVQAGSDSSRIIRQQTPSLTTSWFWRILAQGL